VSYDLDLFTYGGSDLSKQISIICFDKFYWFVRKPFLYIEMTSMDSYWERWYVLSNNTKWAPNLTPYLHFEDAKYDKVNDQTVKSIFFPINNFQWQSCLCIYLKDKWENMFEIRDAKTISFFKPVPISGKLTVSN